MIPRVRLTAAIIAVIATATGCGSDESPDPGPAARKVTVVRGDQTYPMTAEITGWQIKPHPQVPDQGPAAFFTFQFTGDAPETVVYLQVCAVDEHRVVILCDQILSNQTNEHWIGPYPGLSRTADVLLLPDQMDPGLHAGDPKDHDGYNPPRLLSPGDQL
ncbi:hypothetical protein SAMN05421805_1011504 [Saccharopolyspora antimicrobica]|uniref:Lipoprotein n=1 Tax=Saccharopolyspora antimicrobica TaxID=455193 RepID=A0A1I4TNA4_9PSEU|nr:hypothetical protein [Saccharopolyspora antimicrobica]RKT88484.1 hypothetical protein ATL45_6918 [Saccharopolyspora antimicrobica]SFM78234.1 hypothetical protein SAMN05421805_1011504 [Saccharopolyspora antimicrobica]